MGVVIGSGRECGAMCKVVFMGSRREREAVCVSGVSGDGEWEEVWGHMWLW